MWWYRCSYVFCDSLPVLMHVSDHQGSCCVDGVFGWVNHIICSTKFICRGWCDSGRMQCLTVYKVEKWFCIAMCTSASNYFCPKFMYRHPRHCWHFCPKQICMFLMPFMMYIESLKDICRRRLGAEQMLLVCPAVWPYEVKFWSAFIAFRKEILVSACGWVCRHFAVSQ